MRYDPYGAVRWSSGTIPTDKTFTGQRLEGFGLMDYKARYYSPDLGHFIQADTIIPGPGNPLVWDRYAYVLNNPLNYVDPSGHYACEDSFENCNIRKPYHDLDWIDLIRTGVWFYPKSFNSPIDIGNDAIELMTRVILGEEPGKLFGPYEDDPVGVAWAVRNRHDSNYYVERGLCEENKNWYCSAKSNIYGLNTIRALDPIGSLGNWSPWSTQYEAIAAYNRAQNIALKVYNASSDQDIYGGYGRYTEWADSQSPQGQVPEFIYGTTDKGGYLPICTNCTPFSRTHFMAYDWYPELGYRYQYSVCVNTASVCD